MGIRADPPETRVTIWFPLRLWWCVGGSGESRHILQAVPAEHFNSSGSLWPLVKGAGRGRGVAFVRTRLACWLFKLPPGGMTWNRTILSGFRGYSPTDCRLFPSGLGRSLAPLHRRSQAGGGQVWVGQDKSINISWMKAPPAVSGSHTTAVAQPGRLPWLSHYKGITSTSCPHIRPGLSLDPTFMIHRAALFIAALPLDIKPGSHLGDDFYSRVFTSRSFFKLLSI